MKKLFKDIKGKMEADSKKEDKSVYGVFNMGYYCAYWMGYIHAMNDAGLLSDEESNELTAYRDSFFFS